MRRLFTTLLTAGALVAASASPVLTGTLPNGLTYYIQQNATPENSADFFLVQRAGSVFESDSQRGLAHFLEHMCFNGTEHFPGNSIISYLESKGVKFGANLNAYTSTDETVYNISKVPVTSPSTVDSCFLILRDWSCALSLDPAAIDDERGVVVNEWRHRNSASSRMLEKALPALYPGSVYGHRMPIGDMKIVESFSPKTLADFYHKWYHPGNQAVIVVGDIDPQQVLRTITELFSPIPAGKNIISSLPEVPDNKHIIIECQQDAEQGVNLVQLYFKHPEYGDPFAADFATTMLASRFDEAELSPDCPHTYLGIGDVKYLLSHDVHALVMRGVAKPGHVSDAVRLWYTELSRALRHGFSAEETEPAKAAMRKSLNETIRKSQKANNTELARRLVHNFIDREQPADMADEARRDLARLDSLSVDDAMKYLRTVADTTGRNTVLLCYQPMNENQPSADRTELASLFTDVNAAEITPFKARPVSETILADEPARGSIISTEPYHFESTKAYTLSNGIRVLAWHDTSVPGQVFVRGVGSGGLSQSYAPEKVPTMKLINEAIAASGFGSLSNLDLKYWEQTREVKTSMAVSNTEESIEASTTPDHLEDAFRMLYLKATDIKPDRAAFRNVLDSERNKLATHDANPIYVMGDTIHRHIYNYHPLGAKNTAETLDKVDYDLALEIVRDRFADFSDFTFYVAGDYDESQLKDLLERYVASLPAAGRIEKQRDIDYRFTPGNHTLVFDRHMENPVSVVYNFYHGPAEYNLENILAINIFHHALKNRLLADLRESRGWTYSIQGHGSVTAGMNGDDEPVFMMPVYIKVQPGHEEEVAGTVDATIRDMLANGLSPQEIAAAKEYLAKEHREHSDDNAYHLAVMKAFNRFGRDMHTGYLDSLASLSDIHTRVASLTAQRSLLIMKPKDSVK